MAEQTPRRRALVTGARGLLGAELCPALAAAGWQVLAADIEECDITEPDAVRRFVAECQPRLIVNCAAYTAVDRAEAEPDLAFRVNRDGAANVARAAAVVGAALVHMSTDYVFDGEKAGPYTEDDPPHPLGVYGASKLAGELAVRETLPNHFLLRTAWLFGHHGPCFPRTILARARAGQPLRVVNDQIGSPTYTAHLAQAICAIVEQPHYGAYHVANSGACTWYDLAVQVLREAGLPAQVTPVTTCDYPTPARRPANSALDPGKLRRVYGLELPPWQQAVAEFAARWRREHEPSRHPPTPPPAPGGP